MIIKAKAITIEGVEPPTTVRRSGSVRPRSVVLTARYETNKLKSVPMVAAMMPYRTEFQIVSMYWADVMTGIHGSNP